METMGTIELLNYVLAAVISSQFNNILKAGKKIFNIK